VPRWVKRPVEIEAVRYTGINDKGSADFDCFGEPFPRWLHNVFVKRLIYVHRERRLLVASLEGVMVASTGDYIVRGVKGELYPCKPDIFEQLHQRAA
jgi:hypothetical protein